MAPLTRRFSNARRLASRPARPSARPPARPPGRPAALLPIRTPPSSMGGTDLLRAARLCVTPPGARWGLYSLSSVYKWEHLFYEKCNAILLLAWIKLMNVSGEVTLL